LREIFFALHVFSHLFNAGLGDNGITGTKRCNHGKSITTGQDLSCGFPGYFFPYPFLIIKNRSVTSSWQCHAQLGKVPGAPAKYASPAGWLRFCCPGVSFMPGDIVVMPARHPGA
jgi:hypothetical protein